MHRLEHGDGGILDQDDILCDVADDKDRVSSWLGALPQWWFPGLGGALPVCAGNTDGKSLGYPLLPHRPMPGCIALLETGI